MISSGVWQPSNLTVKNFHEHNSDTRMVYFDSASINTALIKVKERLSLCDNRWFYWGVVRIYQIRTPKTERMIQTNLLYSPTNYVQYRAAWIVSDFSKAMITLVGKRSRSLCSFLRRGNGVTHDIWATSQYCFVWCFRSSRSYLWFEFGVFMDDDCVSMFFRNPKD